VQVFQGMVDKAALRLEPHPAEVQRVRWVSLGALHEEARLSPQQFTPWLRIYLDRWVDLGIGRVTLGKREIARPIWRANPTPGHNNGSTA